MTDQSRQGLNRKSRVVTQGFKRAPNRSMLRAVGFTDEDFDKPIIGVANGQSDITPCNAGLGKLADLAAMEIRQNGGMPQTFGTITISDGISMGTEGMKCSLVSREVIADSIETVCRGANMDAVICIGGCDKNMPGAMMAMARLDIPGIFVYGGTIKPGHLQGKDLTVVSAFEAVGEYSAGSINEEELTDIEKNACPGFGSCGGMFTANTMSSAFEAIGMSLPYSSTMANEDKEKELNTQQSGMALFPLLEKNILPRDIMTRKAFENAIAVVMAVGGSTNAVLHLLAIAHSIGVDLKIEDFETIRKKV
ncbi:MAG: dihydroxy-acid dehydratase, partial [Nitrospinaceae bacterium]